MKRLFVLGLAILIFLSSCKPLRSATSSEQSTPLLPNFADAAQTIVSAIKDLDGKSSSSDGSDSSNSQNNSDPTSKPNSSDHWSESSSTPSSTTGDFGYYNARTDSIYPSRMYFTPISIYEKRYYKNLDSKTQEVYRIIDNAVYKMQTGYIFLGNFTSAQVSLAFAAVRHDRPEYYWMPSAYLYDDNDLRNLKLGLGIESTPSTNYLCSKVERKNYDSQIKSALEDLNLNLNAGMSEYDREVAVHEWLVNRVTYDTRVADEYKTYGTSNLNKFAFSSFGALVKTATSANAVCEGYSRALQLALNYVGIECGLVNGEYNGGSHMWNVVKINNRWYHVDSTGNDTENNGFHVFLNISTALILNTHTIDADYLTIDPNNNVSFNFNLPNCNNMDNNYLAVKGQMFSGDRNLNNSIFISALINMANGGLKFCEFGYSQDSSYLFTSDKSSSSYFSNIVNIDYCINSANSRLSAANQISNSISQVGISGCKGILIGIKTAQ